MRRRRDLLLAAATTGTAALAGCIDEFDGSGSEGDDPDENGSDGDPETKGDDGEGDEFEPTFTDDVAEGLVTQYATVTYRADGEGTSSVLFESAEQAFDELAIGETDEGNESAGDTDLVRSTIESTNFETESLVALEAQGPNGCYELQLQKVAASEDDGLVVEAAAVEDREDDETCTTAIVELGMLVRIQYEDDTPVDGDGSINVSGPNSSSGSGWASDSNSAEPSDE